LRLRIAKGLKRFAFGLGRFALRHPVDMGGVDPAIVRNVRMVNVAEFEVPVRESSNPMTALLVALNLTPCSNHQTNERKNRREFDPTISYNWFGQKLNR
jgi:hypothetical protein